MLKTHTFTIKRDKLKGKYTLRYNDSENADMT